MKNHVKRKGITLMEMVIVMALFSILTSAVFISHVDSAASADASQIIANFDAIKKGVSMWYADNKDTFQQLSQNHKNIHQQADILADICNYFRHGKNFVLNDGGSGKIAEGGYGICNIGSHRTTWCVGYKFDRTEGNVKEKLKNRIKMNGLHFTEEWPNPGGIDPDSSVKSGDKVVWMHILGDFSDTSKWTKPWVK